MAKTAPKAVLFSMLIVMLSLHPTFRTEAESMETILKISSPKFSHNGMIPPIYTCDGRDVSPPLTIEGVPEQAVSLALIVDDPDAPAGTWVHWLVWNIDPGTGLIAEGSAPKGALQGTNDFRKRSYGGPCPPSGTHRYFFKLYALDAMLPAGAGATKTDLERSMKDHVVAQAELIGLYRRK